MTFLGKHSWFLFMLTLSGFGATLTVWMVKLYSPDYKETVHNIVAPVAAKLTNGVYRDSSALSLGVSTSEAPFRIRDPFAAPNVKLRRSPYSSPKKRFLLTSPQLSQKARIVKEDLESADSKVDVYQCIACGHVRSLGREESPSKLVDEPGCNGGSWEMMFPGSTPHEYRAQKQMVNH